MTGTLPASERVTAGLASRVAAMMIDVVVIGATFYGGLALGSLTVQVLRFRQLDASAIPAAVVTILLGCWTALYFWVGWFGFAKTIGKALVGLRVVRFDGGRVSWSRALLRLVGYALSALALGLGFAWVAVDRRHRAWHDILAGTRVVYDWQPHGRPTERRLPA